MDWNDLRYFLAVWRTGTLAGAGRALKVDATTVGRRIAALEHDLGTRLFDRVPDGLALTGAGERLVDTAEQVERNVIDLERRAAGDDQRLDGTVRVAATEAMAVAFVAAGLMSLQREHPGICVELAAGSGALNLVRREADIALRAGAKPAQQSLVVKKVGVVAFVLAASRDYVAERPWDGTLTGHRVVGYDHDLAHIPGAVWLAENGAGATVALRTNSILAAGEACAAGWGLAALPAFVARRSALVPVRSEPVATVDLWLVVHADLARTARVRAVIEHLGAVAREALA